MAFLICKQVYEQHVGIKLKARRLRIYTTFSAVPSRNAAARNADISAKLSLLERNMRVCSIIFLARQITLARPTTKKESISIWKNMNRKYMDK